MKKHFNFIIRAVDLLLILAVLWQYQQVALVRADAVTARQKEIDEANAWNTSVLQAAEEAEAESGLKDGTYEGTALGFGDDITVQITISGGQMTDITVLQHDGEDKPYYTQALTMLDMARTASRRPSPVRACGMQCRTHWERRRHDADDRKKAADCGPEKTAHPEAPGLAAGCGAADVLYRDARCLCGGL